MNQPGHGNYNNTTIKNGTIHVTDTTDNQSIVLGPTLDRITFGYLRVLAYSLPITEIAKSSGYSVLSFSSMLKWSHRGGLLNRHFLRKCLLLVEELIKEIGKKEVEKLRIQFTPVNGTDNCNFRWHKDSRKLINKASESKTSNTIHPAINDTYDNRPEGTSHWNKLTSEIQSKLKCKLNKLGCIKKLAEKIRYSPRHTQKLLNHDRIGRPLHPEKSIYLIQYANSIEDIN